MYIKVTAQGLPQSILLVPKAPELVSTLEMPISMWSKRYYCGKVVRGRFYSSNYTCTSDYTHSRINPIYPILYSR
jgi:hypothetical protein